MSHHIRAAATLLCLLLTHATLAAPRDQGSAPAADADRQATLQQRIETIEAALKNAPKDTALQTDLARMLHLKGVAGDTQATSRSGKLFEALAKDNPDDPLIGVYLGSNSLIRASRTWAVWRKGELTKAGLEQMDTAVAAAEDHVEVRFIRGVSMIGLPDWMERRELAEEDLAWVAGRAEAAVEAGELEAFMAASALLHHGRAQAAAGDAEAAKAAWTLAVSLAPQSQAGQDAKAELDAMS